MTKPRVWLFIWFFIGSGGSIFAQDDQDFYREEIEEILSQYSATGLAVMNLLDSLPQDFVINGSRISRSSNKNWSKYIDNPFDISQDLSTTVHESFHSLEGSLSYHLIQQSHPETYQRDDGYNSYFIDHNKPILVKRTVLYNSHELKDLIPEALRKYRYKRYIEQPRALLSAQKHGIYGLMEEWNAYYLGNRTGVDLYPYYLERAKTKPRDMLEYVSQVGGSYFAYYEFKYFILKYLERARYSHKEVYTALLANTELRRAYTEIDMAFASLIEEFLQSLEQIKTDLAPYTDKEIKIWPGVLYIDGSGSGFFQEVVDEFKKALNKGSLKRIESEFILKSSDQ